MQIYTADYWIDKLKLQAHPEGGYYRQVYVSTETIPGNALPGRFTGDRPFSTSIFFLLKSKEVSLFHRVKSDEIWHYYTGSSLVLSTLEKDAGLQQYILGPDPENNQDFQRTISAGSWMAAEVIDSNSFTLVGCTVAPGFVFEDFELAAREKLLVEFPAHRDLITKFTTG